MVCLRADGALTPHRASRISLTRILRMDPMQSDSLPEDTQLLRARCPKRHKRGDRARSLGATATRRSNVFTRWRATTSFNTGAKLP